MSIVKNLEKPVQKYRFIIQTFFILLCVWIGVEFYLFVGYLESGGTGTFYERPPGVEAFLPVSSLMSLYYFLLSGIIHQAHPAGFFIFIAIVVISLVFGKSFCSWICPFGLLSEYIGDFGDKVQKKLFKKIYRLPRWLDYPLRSLKYLILGFFALAIFSMSEFALKIFLDGSYNIISDVKMYYFFADISRFSLIVITVLFILSIFIRNFWCRYLCPYGALLGFAALLSPNKIKRNVESCTDCGLCTKVCPSMIKVDRLKTIVSDECTTCMNCVDVCPVNDTLQLQNIISKKKTPKKVIVYGIVILFLVITGIGVITGNWQNSISKEEYLIHTKNKNSIDHLKDLNEANKMNNEKLKKPKN